MSVGIEHRDAEAFLREEDEPGHDDRERQQQERDGRAAAAQQPEQPDERQRREQRIGKHRSHAIPRGV